MPWLLALLLSLLVCGCRGKGKLQPGSGGRPYELLVTGSDAEAVDVVAHELKTLTESGLPQPEASFDVSAIGGKDLGQATRYARNIVLVSTDAGSLKQPSITYERDAYAQPQLIIHVRAASASQLRDFIKYNVRAIGQQFVLQELNNGIQLLREHHSKRAEQMAKAMYGMRLWIPEDLTRWKRGKDFVWFSNDASKGMQNICIYRCPGSDLSTAAMLHRRDSVMRENLPGEEPSMYMTTCSRGISAQQVAQGHMEMRGLWEMRGDAMGGPFVSHSLVCGDSILTVEAFVYAPGMKKRNLLRRLEACLYTVKAND